MCKSTITQKHTVSECQRDLFLIVMISSDSVIEENYIFMKEVRHNIKGDIFLPLPILVFFKYCCFSIVCYSET